MQVLNPNEPRVTEGNEVGGMDIVLVVVDEFKRKMWKPRAGAFSHSQTPTSDVPDILIL